MKIKQLIYKLRESIYTVSKVQALYLLLCLRLAFILLSVFYYISLENRLQFELHIVKCYIFKCHQSLLNHNKWSVLRFFFNFVFIVLYGKVCLLFLTDLLPILQTRSLKPNIDGGIWLWVLLFWGFGFKLYGCYVLWLSQKIFPFVLMAWLSDHLWLTPNCSYIA